MEICEWCNEEVGNTVFTAFVEGRDKRLCRTCFFLHLEGENYKIIQRVMGFKSSEKLFSTD